MLDYTLSELTKQLRNKSISSTELTRHALKAINTSKLNAFINSNEELALRLAADADAAIAEGKATPLTGIPMALKDNFCTVALPTTCASKMLAHYTSPFESTISSRLLRAGAVLVGKTNMDEFAMGSSSETSYFGPTLNPWDKNRTPGGSSGGSAAAVSAGLVSFSLGSDTGGSIRQPASFCGISGIKPTYGLLSRFGMVAYASSLDQAGPMAQTAEDLALILDEIAGFDPNDATSSPKSFSPLSNGIHNPKTGLKIGVPKGFFNQGIDSGIEAAVLEAAKTMERMGATLIDVDIKHIPLWIPCYYVIACAEASSNLSRYDGVRFGHRSETASSIHELITHSRSEGFGEEVKRRILLGTHVLSSGFYDAIYLQALKVRRMIQRELIELFQQVDVILGPTTPSVAPLLGETLRDPVHSYMSDIFTVAANLGGFPAVSIPCGQSQGLPVGVQLMGHHFSESSLLGLAHQYQQHTDWHKAKPV